MLGSVDWSLITDASVQSFCPIFKGQATQGKLIGCTETSINTIGLLKP